MLAPNSFALEALSASTMSRLLAQLDTTLARKTLSAEFVLLVGHVLPPHLTTLIKSTVKTKEECMEVQLVSLHVHLAMQVIIAQDFLIRQLQQTQCRRVPQERGVLQALRVATSVLQVTSAPLQLRPR